MYNSLKMSLSFIILFFFSIVAVQADCIVTTKNFSKSSRVIYVNPTNGSDQLAKIYNYNLGNQRNPYEPKNIVAFQNLNEALANRNTRNGDLVLVKTGRTWTRYDDWSQNKSSEFNKQSAQASGYSQRQCQGEHLTWVPSAVTDTQSADTAPVTEFSNTDDITIANTEIVTSRNTTSNQVATAPQSTNSPTTSRRSSGGASSGGASSRSDSLSSTDNTLPLEQNETTSYSRGLNKSSQNTLTETPLQDEVIAELDPDFTEGKVIDEDVTPVVNEPDNLNQDYATECTADAPWENAIQTYPQDSQGWSIIKPDNETRIIYVSSSEGSDTLARPYLSAEVNDPFNPVNIQPYKTIEKAYEQIRDGKPDWILFKKGERFELNKILWLKSGKSQNAHIVFSSYGPKNAKRPIIETGSTAAFQGIKNRSFITLVGLEFYAAGLDPNSNKFLGWEVKGGSAVSLVAGTGKYGDHAEGIHIENNRISYYRNGIIIGGTDGAVNKNVVIRRNEILNSYNVHGHSQGIFLNRLTGALIEENVFDHNGWFQQRPLNVSLNSKTYGYATFFNHNVYIANSSYLMIRKNLSSRSSSIGMKFASNSNSETKVDTINSSNIFLKDNLIVEGEVGFSIGGNKDFNNGYRWDKINVIGNVLSNIGRTRPTNRNLSFNIEINDWASGTVCSNVMSDNNGTVTNVTGITATGFIGNLEVNNNQLINIGINTEEFENTENIKTNNNTYLPILDNTNFLDSFVRSNGYNNYKEYISTVIRNLHENPTDYYDVDEAISYIKNKAILAEKN